MDLRTLVLAPVKVIRNMVLGKTLNKTHNKTILDKKYAAFLNYISGSCSITVVYLEAWYGIICFKDNHSFPWQMMQCYCSLCKSLCAKKKVSI